GAARARERGVRNRSGAPVITAVRCCACDRLLRGDPAAPDKTISHGYCEPCGATAMRQMDEYFGHQEQPAMEVDGIELRDQSRTDHATGIRVTRLQGNRNGLTVYV